MRDISKHLDALSPNKRELLELLLREKEESKAAEAQTIPRRRGDEPLVPSFAQQRLWFMDQLAPGSAAYNIPAAVRLTGDLDVGLLERACHEVVRRHESLRTTFSAAEGRPLLVIAPELRLPLSVDDLAGRETEALRRVADEAGRPFDLGSGPLLRLGLLRLAEGDHVLLLIIHHIISDVWSIGVFFREIVALYEAFSAGRPSPLPELAIQYPDFALWQQQWLSGDGPRRQVDFWKKQLAGAPTVLDLPTDRPRPPMQTFRGARCNLFLHADLMQPVQALGQLSDASVFMVLQAVFAILLTRSTGQEEVLTGTPMANRTRVELERLIGFFVNMIVVRSDLRGDPTFGELLGRVREATLGAYANHDLPLEKVLEELAPEREPSRNPLFQAAFAFQNAPVPPLAAPGLTVRPFEILERTARFDLELDLRDVGNGYGGFIGFNTDLFEPATVKRMARRFEALLAAAGAAPERRISELPLLTREERRQILEEWNDTAADYPRDDCIHQLFEAQAALDPEAVALAWNGARMTYGDLDRRANRLARRLRKLGVGPEGLVGVCVERSFELIVGLLAILKAGGAYVPLDASYPDERLAFMLKDTDAQAVLVHEETRKRLEGRARLLAVDGGDWESEEDGPLGVRVPAEGLAVVIYTSGSTGRPKGVALPHRGVVRLVREANDMRVFRGDRMAHANNISFDAATLEIWGALLNGAALVLIPREVALAPPALAASLRREGVTAMVLTTALFDQIVREAPAALAPLRLLMFGGEAANPATLASALREGAPERLVNIYGPAESTTVATTHRVREVPAGAVTVPIGLPISNSTAYILDRRHSPVPAGVVGELCIGGDGLARAYLNRPDLTAERFVPDPFAAAPGGRLYRTGDLARWLPEGRIDFLGRTDHQVKLRGFRIELGEIEAVLGRHPGVGQPVVAVREDGRGDKRLVAWFVPLSEPAPTVAELRAFLGERLPGFMVPTAFAALPALPLTANGKVDWQALPAPDGARPDLAAARVMPSTPMERELAAIWSEVLEVEEVGARDDFFELGGQSLLATQIVSRIRDAYGVEVLLRRLFQQPTVAGLAAIVQEAVEQGGTARKAPPLVPVPREGPLPLSFSQERLWFLDQLAPGLAAYNIPGAVRLTGRLDLPALERALNEIVRRHEVLRTTFGSVDGRVVASVAPESALYTPMVDLRALPEPMREAEALRWANAAAGWPFDLARGPLLRTLMLRTGERGHVMALVLHHIVYDMWSREIFLAELATLYTAFAEGRPAPLPELRIQYADFAAWQRQWLTGEVLAEQLAYWQQALAGIPASLELPSDRPRPAVQTFRGRRAFLDLSPELTGDLRGLSQREGVTLFIVLLAGFYTLLSRYTGKTDLPVGSPIANRNRTETEALIGFFANTLVLRGDVSGGVTFRELLGRVRETALGAYSHQDLAFEQLVNELQPSRDLGRQPLFQVMFNFVQNYMPPAFDLPDLRLAPDWVHSGEVQFDFTLSMWESGGRLHGALDYSTDLFCPSTMRRLLGHFGNLLASAAADPGGSTAGLRLMGEAELHQILAGWNDTADPALAGRTFPDLFSAAPSHIAAVAGEERLTYGELRGRVERLARRLAALGVGPDTVVALLAGRGLDLLTAILGVIEVGGAYLPLDPAHPARRHRQVLEQSGAPLVLAAESLLPNLDWPCLLSLEQILAGEGWAEAPLQRAAPDNLAYVIFTSGSTGVPKGAMVHRRGLLNHLRAKVRDLALTADDAVAQNASQCFDVSVWQMLAPLAAGGRVHIYPDEVAHDPERLLDRAAADRITVLEVVPSMLSAMLDDPRPELPALRWLLTAGEALPPDTCRRWLAACPAVPLVNAYGPTECTDNVTHAFLAGFGEEARVPIGRTIANLRLRVLDREMRPVPIGVAGELCVAGPGVGRGYLHDPARTAASFLPDPLASSPGERLYRTGDLAHWLPDGQLAFLGRLDHQIKIRGFRIEPGEIEAALRQHPGVREAVVLARPSGSDPSDLSLAAYLVMAGAPEPEDAELLDFLRSRLPAYMVPPGFARIAAMPRTPNGKLDRAALLALGGPEPVRPAFVAPRTPVEERIAAIWSEVLGHGPVGVHDNFFELGGHSLLVTRVASRLRAAFALDLPLRTLFEAPTVTRIADRVETLLWASRSAAPADEAAAGEEEGEL